MDIKEFEDIKPLSIEEAAHLSYAGSFSNHPERIELLKKWQRYFGYYNANNKHKLSMSCIVCYFKVYEYIKQELQKLHDESGSTN